MAVDVIIDPLTGQIYWNDSQGTAQSIAISGNGTDLIKTVGYSLQFSASPSGTITTGSATTAVTGSGTNFLTLFGSGASGSGAVLYTSQGTSIGTISTVSSDTALTLQANASGSYSGITFRYSPPAGTDRLIFSDSSTPIYPATTGANLGTSSYRWSLYASAGDITNSGTTAINLMLDKSGIGSTESPALQFINTTAATSGAQYQFAPWNEFRGKAWNTGSSASNDVRMRMGMAALSGNTPTAELVVAASVDTGTASWYYPLTLNATANDSVMYLNNGVLSIGKLLTNGTTSSYALELYNYSLATSGQTANWSPAFEMNGSAWNTSTATSNILRFRSEVQTTSGNPISGSIVWKSAITTSYSATPSFSNNLSLSNTNGLGLWNANTAASYLKASGSQSSDIVYTFPASAPTTNQVLSASSISGSSITLTWATASGSGTVNSGASGKIAYYPSAGTTVDDATALDYSASSPHLTITSQATTSIPLKLTGIASQSVDLFQVATSGGNVFTVGSAGISTFANNTAASGTTSGALIITGGIGVGSTSYLSDLYSIGTILSATSATTVNISTSAATKTINIGTGGTSSHTTTITIGTTAGTSTLTIDSPTIGTNTTSLTLFNTNASTVNAFGAGTALTLGATTGTTTIRNTTATFSNATVVNFNGNDPVIQASTTGTVTLFNTSNTTVNAFGAATAMTLGAATGTASIRNTTVTLTNATVFNINGNAPVIQASTTGTVTLFNTSNTTVNAFGAATALNMGSTAGTATIANATVTFSNAATVNINGNAPIIQASTTGTVTLFNTSNTTVNAFGAATAVSLGAATGTFTIGNTTLTLTNATNLNASAVSTLNLSTTVTGASTLNIGTGAVAGATKAINIGTAGSATGTTTIIIGTTSGTSTIALNGITTLSSALAVGSGGTGTSTAPTQWGIIFATSTSQYSSTGAGTNNQWLRAVTSGAPTWSTASLATTYTQYDLVYASGSNALTGLANSNTSVLVSQTAGPVWLQGATGNRLLKTSGSAISWSQADLTTDVTGVLPIANGGTQTSSITAGGVVYMGSTAATGLQALSPATANKFLVASGTATTNYPAWSTATLATTYAVGDLLYASSANTVGGLTSTATSVLITQGAAAPSWLQGATANRVLKTSGSAISWSQVDLTTDVTGTLPVANGGTGVANIGAGRIMYGNNTGAIGTDSRFTWSGSNQTLTLDSTSTTTSNLLITSNNITTNSYLGIQIANNSSATVSVTAQYSPGFEFLGHVWNTTPTAADNTARFREELQVTSSASPTATLVWKSSVDTGTASFTDRFKIDSTGLVTIPGSLSLGSASGALSASSGTVSVGTLSVANGGTGQTTYTDGQLLIGNSTGSTLTKATLTAGTNITITNGPGSITINATSGGSGTVNSGAAGKIAYYPSASTTVDDATALDYSTTTTHLTITAQGATTSPLELVGAASQTANFLNVKNSSGTSLISFATTSSGSGAKLLIQGTSSNQDDLLRIENSGTYTIAGGYAGQRGLRVVYRTNGNNTADRYFWSISRGYDGFGFFNFGCDETTGVGLTIGSATEGFPLSAKVIEDATTDTVKDVINIERTTSGTAAAGIGGRISFRQEHAGGTLVNTIGIDGLLSNAGSTTYVGALSIKTNSAGTTTLSERVRIDNTSVQLSPIGTSAGNTNELRFLELAANGSGYIALKAPDSIATNYTYVLPDAAPSAGQLLSASAPSGGVVTLSWATDQLGTSGGGITSLNSLTAASQSFVNDTNVTITSVTATHTIGWSGTLAVGRGGTGTSTAPTQWGVVFATSTAAYNSTAAGSTNQWLRAVTSGAPTWSTATLATTYAVGDLLYASASNTVGGLTSTATSVLITQGAAAPSWLQGATANRLLKTSGSAISWSQADLTTDVTGILPVGNGGTGTSTAPTQWGVMFATSTAAIRSTAAGSTNQWLAAVSSGAPVWSTATLATTFTAGQFVYASGANALTGLATTTFSVDTTNIRIGIGTSGASSPLHVLNNATATNTVVVMQTIDAQSSGTPANGFGGSIVFDLESTTTAAQDAASIETVWATATHASRLAELNFKTNDANTSTLTERMSISNITSAQSSTNATVVITGTLGVNSTSYLSSVSLNTALAIASGGTNTSSFATTNGLVYFNGTNLLTTNAAASGVLVTNGSNVPSVGTDIPTAVTIGGSYIYRASGTDVPLADGGTNASLTASAGGIVYSTASAMAINTPGSSGQPLLSGGAGAPTFGTLGMGAGGTGLTTTTPGANYILGMNNSNNGLEYKQLVQGSNITITHAANSVTITASGGSATPGGSNTQIQYNNAGALGGISNFTFASNLVSLTNATNFANTSTAGMELKYSTAAGTTTVNNNSPALDFIGRIYASAADRHARIRQEIQTTAATPAHAMVWSSSYDTGTASYTKVLSLHTVDGLGFWNYSGTPGTAANYFKTGNQASDIKYTWPTTAPTLNQVLSATAVSGSDITLGWATGGGGGGSGTVGSGTINQLAYYSGATTTASDASLVRSATGTHLTITAQGATTSPLKVVGAASQSAALFTVATSGGDVLVVGSTGNITTGTWQGSTVGVAYGGTGQTTYTDGQLLIGNTTGNTLTKATLTAGNGIGVTNGSGSITVRTKRVMNIQLASGFNPPVGADTAVIRIPESPTDGTTSVTYNVRKLFCRVETPSSGTTTFQVEYYTGTSAFSGTNLLTSALSVTGASTYEFNTTGFTTSTLATGAKIRLNFSAVDSTHASFSINLLLEEN